MKEIKEKITNVGVEIKAEAEKVIEFIEKGLHIEPKGEGEAVEIITAPDTTPAPVDNDHVAEGATPFTPEEIALNKVEPVVEIAAPEIVPIVIAPVSEGEPKVNWAHLD